MKAQTIGEAVAKLRVKPGLQGTSQRIDKDWSIFFGYVRDEKFFYLDLHYGFRKTRMQLAPEDVETRTRSTWMTDATYRLSAVGLVKAESEVRRIIETVAARRAQQGEK